MISADGSGDAIQLVDRREFISGVAISPDGTHVAFGAPSSGTNLDLWTVPIDLSGDTPRATGEPTLFLGTPFQEALPAFSRDGRWIAYISNETGRSGLFVRPFPGADGKAQIADGVTTPTIVWSPDGKDLMYVDAEGQLMAVAYSASGSTFTPGVARRVNALGPQDRLEDIAPDGRSFAISRPGEDASTGFSVTFVVNVFDEIRRRLNEAPSDP